MTDKLAVLTATAVLAVVRAPSPASAVRATEALVAGGVTGIEITYSTPDAVRVIAELTDKFGDQIYLGAGTVRTPKQATDAVAAGARFLVSPGTVPDLTRAMIDTGTIVMSGALTASEVMVADDLGVDVIKIFPAALGGPSYFGALRGPFPDVAMMPTGGVNPGNLSEWFGVGAVAVGAGSDLCSGKDLAAGRYDEVERKARDFSAALSAWREANGGAA